MSARQTGWGRVSGKEESLNKEQVDPPGTFEKYGASGVDRVDR